MANAVWKGSSGPQGNNWNVASNWSTGVVPQAGDTVTIPSGTPAPNLSGGSDTIAAFTVANGGSADLTGNLTVTGDFIDNGGATVDTGFLTEFGGSTLTIGGMLTVTNSGAGFSVGNRAQTSPTTVNTAALTNTGSISIAGNASGALARINVASVAGFGGMAGVLTGNINLGIGIGGAGGAGNALLDFLGGGLINTIQSGTVQLTGANAFIATGNATTSNSALAGPLTIAAGGGLLLQSGATVATQDLTIAGTAAVDTGFLASGGSLLTTSTLTITGSLTIGRSAMTTAGGMVAASGGLANSGSISLSGDIQNKLQGVLEIGGAAGFGTAGTLSGNVTLADYSLLHFASGQISAIDKTGNLVINGTNAFLASGPSGAGSPGNSALTALTADAGFFTLLNGAQLTTTTDLSIGNGTNNGFLNIDNSGAGGSTLHVGGALTFNTSGNATFGNNGITAATTVTASGLGFAGSNASIAINGGKPQSSGTALATLTVAAAAGFGQPGVLAGGNLTLTGMALLDFTGGGQITTTGFGANLIIDGANAFIASGNATSSNSALTGLATLGGDFRLSNSGTVAPAGNLAIGDGSHGANTVVDSGALLQVGGTLSLFAFNDALTVSSGSATAAALSNGGQVRVAVGGALSLAGDAANTGSGTITVSNSLVHAGGTVINGGSVMVGGSTISAATTLSAAAIANTGKLVLTGGKAMASLVVTGDAGFGTAGAVTGDVELHGSTLVTFGGGNVSSIAAGSQLLLDGGSAVVADAGDTASSSALTGLAVNSGGMLLLENGATLATDSGTDFNNQPGTSGGPSGDRIGLDDIGGGGSGGSTLTIGGTLNNTGNVFLGNSFLSAATTLTAAALNNTGSLNIFGNSNNSVQGTVTIAGAAPSAWSGSAALNFDALLEFGGNTGITTIGAGAGVTLNGSKARIALASASGSNSAFAGLGSNLGTLYLANGASLSTTGNLTNSAGATLKIDDGSSGLTAGGSVIAIGGILINSGSLTVGTSNLTASTGLTTAGLINTGAVTLTGASGKLAKFTMTGAASNSGTVTVGAFATLDDGASAYIQAGGSTVVAGTLHAGAVMISGGTLELATGGVVNAGIAFGSSSGGRLQIDGAVMPTNTISGFAPGAGIDLANIAFDKSGAASLQAGNVLQVTENGKSFSLQLDPNQNFSGVSFHLGTDAGSGTLITELPPAPSQSPAVLNDFGWAQGWGSPNNPRLTADLNGDGTTDYLGFGFNAVFVGYGGTFGDGQGHVGPGFAATVPAVQDFGTNEGYTAQVQRGAAATGAGVGDVLYGQGFAGVYWYAATSATPQTDAAGHTYNVLNYQNSPNLYGNFGSQQGWTPDNGFQILKANASDPFASIFGFGNDGIVVGPQAFAPGATAANSYLLPLAVGNNSGWKQSVDIRTFTDAKGNTIDLNHDGIADFVGMGPQGLVYAFGNNSGPGGGYGLGALQTAHISGGNADLGEAQGWTDTATLRYVVADPQTGFDDILAFGAPGVFVSMGQDPATHNGEPFGQLYLAMPDFGANQGWSVQQTPRIVGDVNGDGIPDIVGFGATSTFVAVGSRDAAGNLHFALAPNDTIADFGYTEGWSGTNPQTVRALADFKTGGTTHSDLVLSGAFNTQVWQFA